MFFLSTKFVFSLMNRHFIDSTAVINTQYLYFAIFIWKIKPLYSSFLRSWEPEELTQNLVSFLQMTSCFMSPIRGRGGNCSTERRLSSGYNSANQVLLTEDGSHQSSVLPTSLVGHDPKYPNRAGSTCHICGKWFLLPKDLRRHVRIHTGEKPFKCPVCPYRAAVKGNVKQHVLNTHNMPFDTKDCRES